MFMNKQKRKGFTLTETVLAIGVVGVLIVAFVAMFYPARKIVLSAMTVQEADKIVDTLQNELNIVRKTERTSSGTRISTKTNYTSSFDKAFYWMLQTAKPETTILIYSYRGDLEKAKREDGTFYPLETGNYIPGKDSILVTAACLATDPKRTSDLEFADGPVFAVRMTQLVVDTRGGLTKYLLADGPGKIVNPYPPRKAINKPEDYVYNQKNRSERSWGAEVLYYAEFFQLASKEPGALRGKTWEQIGKNKPVFTRNLVFRR